MNNEYKLEELYELQMGKTPSRNDVSLWQTRDAKWISVGDLSNCGKYIYDTKEYLSDKAIQESHIKEIPAETLVMSFKLSLGKTAITKEKMYSNEAIMAFIDKHTVPLLNDYMYYLLSAKNWDEGTNKAVLGKTLNKATLSNIKVKIHPLPQQEKIASTLDKITSLISLHQKQLAKLDELVKARFVEMFGDTESNSKHIEIRKLGSISEKISDGVHAKPEYTVDGKPFLSVININTGKIVFDNCKYVSEESYKKMIKSTFPEKGDVLYTKVGATYGIPAYVDTDRKFCLYVSVCLIKPKHDEINSRFLSLQMGMPFIKHQADKRIKGIGVPDLHLNQIKDFDILCPRREDQEKYVDFAHKVEEAKKPIQESLNRLQTLKASLMQEYFS